MLVFPADLDMRRPWAHQPFANLRRCPPMNCLLLCVVIVAAIIAVFGLSSRGTLDPMTSSAHDIYKNYRRLREQAVTEYLELRALSQGSAQLKELDLCGKDVENHVPCYNVTANQLAGYREGEEYDRHCEVAGVGPRCLVRTPKEYKIPLRWPAGRDVIWSGNVKITKDQFLSSGSLTKRYLLVGLMICYTSFFFQGICRVFTRASILGELFSSLQLMHIKA